MAERVAIVGARDADDRTLAAVRAYVAALPDGTVVISGGATGVDQVAARAATERGLEVAEYTCNWAAHELRGLVGHDGNWCSPPFFRNTILAIACTRMVAFVRDSRGGTWDSVRQAKRFGRPCDVRRD